MKTEEILKHKKNILVRVARQNKFSRWPLPPEDLQTNYSAFLP